MCRLHVHVHRPACACVIPSQCLPCVPCVWPRLIEGDHNVLVRRYAIARVSYVYYITSFVRDVIPLVNLLEFALYWNLPRSPTLPSCCTMLQNVQANHDKHHANTVKYQEKLCSRVSSLTAWHELSCLTSASLCIIDRRFLFISRIDGEHCRFAKILFCRGRTLHPPVDRIKSVRINELGFF